MARPVTLFTGQWADLPLEELAQRCGGWGFDGLELACWGDHFEVDRALADDGYVRGKRELLERHGLNVWAIGAHLVGQAVSDRIDERHRAILPPEIFGDGGQEGVRQRAAERMKDTARAAARLGVTQVNGFTGSPVWHLLYSFPPNDFGEIERAYGEVAERWGPIMDVFDAEGVRFGLEVHPTEIAYDFVTTRKTLDAIGNREAFGINLDPSHFAPQFLDAAEFALEFGDRIYHVHVKDSRRRLERASFDSRLPSQLRRGGTRLGLRLARSRRRRLRGAPPGAQPDRLPGPTVDRVGGQRHGSRLWRAARARLRPAYRLLTVVDRVRRGDAEGGRVVSDTIGIGMLGYAFMGKAHANGYKKLSYMAWPPPLEPRLVSIAGRDEAAVAEAARRYGFDRYVTDWHDLVADPDVQLFDNSGPNNLHAEPTIAAAEAGKHVLCEKPLGRDANESYDLWQRVEAAGVKHMTAFNYRFVPAVRLARQMIEAGELGDLLHFRGRYLQEWGTTTADVWRFHAAEAGSGALGDLGAHVVDLARYLVGEIGAVSASVRTFVPGREVDDAFEAVADFDGTAVGTIEATRFAAGRKNALCWEINGTKGSLAFDLERLNELQHSEGTKGFRTILVTEADHPFWKWWWPHGHIIGWEHTFVHEIHHLLTAIAEDGDVAPHGATFEDGYRAAEVCDAILRSAVSGAREAVTYRS